MIVIKTLKLVLRIIFELNIIDVNTPFRLMNKEILEKYISSVFKNSNLSNVILMALFMPNNEKVKFIPITFRPRQSGVNSINIRKITKIGVQSV